MALRPPIGMKVTGAFQSRDRKGAVSWRVEVVIL